jgi:hypothetical protein
MLVTHAIPSPVATNRLRDTMSAGAPTAKPAGGRNKYIAASDAVAVAITPGSSPAVPSGDQDRRKELKIRNSWA